MALVTSALPLTQAAIVKQLPIILSHRFPRIRAMCAEQLYLALSEAIEDEMNPRLEEDLLETEWTGDGALEKAEGVAGLVAEQLAIRQ